MELIKRTSDIEKETVSTRGYNQKMQISYNNFGHIVLRFFDSDFTPLPVKWKSICKYDNKPIHTVNGSYPTWFHDDTNNRLCEGVMNPDNPGDSFYAEPNEDIPMTKPKDIVVVLDQTESTALIRFIQNTIREWS